MIAENATMLDSAAKNGLSLAALGVLTFLLAKEDGRLTIDEMMLRGRMGREKAYRLIGELRRRDYVVRRIARERGRVVGGWYEIAPKA